MTRGTQTTRPPQRATDPRRGLLIPDVAPLRLRSYHAAGDAGANRPGTDPPLVEENVMQRPSVFFWLLLAACTALIACDADVSTRTLSPEDVIVYGTASCGFTTGLMDDLDGAGIPYTFKDLETDPGAQQELIDKLATADWFDGGPVDLPVVDVRDTLLMRPTLEEVEALL